MALAAAECQQGNNSKRELSFRVPWCQLARTVCRARVQGARRDSEHVHLRVHVHAHFINVQPSLVLRR